MQKKSSICSLQHMGLLQVQGPDAESFLEGQLTISLKKVTDQALQRGGYCNLKGRLHSIFYIIRHPSSTGPSFLLLAPLENLSHLENTLKKFALFSKVSINRVTPEWHLLGIWGDPSHLPFKTYPISQTRSIALESTAPTIDCQSHLLWIADDIRDKYPWIIKETEQKFLAHHLNLPQLGAVDFKKGCYVGQEIIARMEYLAKNKKNLHVAIIDNIEPIAAGNSVLRAGELVNSIHITPSSQIILFISADEDLTVS